MATAHAKLLLLRKARPAATPFRGFGDRALTFLRGLERNNKAAWFEKHRGEWESELLDPARAFITALGPQLREITPRIQFEPKIGGSIFRMNRDTRFSKDKTPFRTHLDLWLWEGPNRGWEGSGYFFRLKANELVVGAGRHAIAGPALSRFRKAVGGKPGIKLAAIADGLRAQGWRIGEVTLKKVPAGYPSDHERADLLRHGSLFAELASPVPEELTKKTFVRWCSERFAQAAPIHAWIMEHVA